MGDLVAYLGPPGTFAEEAALLYAGQDSGKELVPYASITAAATAVKTRLAAEGVVPIENSLEGSVNETLDLLIRESPGIAISGELVLPIVQCLMVRPGTRADQVAVVYSHPQALPQCRRFLDDLFGLNTEHPRVRLEASLSTAKAVQDMMEAPGQPASGAKGAAAAIGPRRAAQIYGAEILADGIQDSANNVTRFIVLGRTDHARTGRDKTSICFYIVQDRPGALRDILAEFADRSINLSKIESRPSKESLGRYYFLADLEGHREDPPVAEALKAIETQATVKVFGSYPRAPGDANGRP